MVFRLSSRLDLGQHFPAVLARQVQVQHDHVRPRGLGIRALAAQKLHRLHAVLDDAHMVAHLEIFQRFDGQLGIAGAVFHQQDFNRARFGCCS